MDIYAYKSGEYTVTAYSADNSTIRQQATIKILSLADVERTELMLDEPATVSISEAGSFKMFSFTPETDGKYYFETKNISNSVRLYLYDAEWNQVREYGYMYSGYKMYHEMEAGKTYYLKASFSEQNSTGSYTITTSLNIPVESISLEGLDGMSFYPGEWKNFTYTLVPDNATNRGIGFYYNSKELEISTYSNETRAEIYGRKSGEYTITAYSYDDSSITATATVTVLSLADVESTELTLNETVNASITAPATFNVYSFTPEEAGKYYFETSNADHSVYLTLYDDEWNRIDSYGYVSNYRWFRELEKDKTYHLQVRLDSSYTSGTYELAVGLNIPVQSINLESIDGASFYPGEWMDFTYSVLPENASNQYVSFIYNSNELSFSTYSSGGKNHAQIYGKKSGEYTITAYSQDDSSITATATVTVLSFADIPSVALTLDETVSGSIEENEEFDMVSFALAEDGKYYFETSNVEHGIYLRLYDADWNPIASYGYMGNGSRWFRELSGGQTYHIQITHDSAYTSESYEITVKKNIPVTSINLEGLDGMSFYPGEWKDFTYSVLPENATNQYIWYYYDSSELDFSNAGENRAQIYGRKSGEYTITAYSQDNSNITTTATVTVLSLADVERTELQLDESAAVSISEAGTFQMFSFTPDEDEKYYFETSQVIVNDWGASIQLYDQDWNRLTESNYLYNGSRMYYELDAGKTYYLQARLTNNSYTGSYNLTAGKVIPVTSITLDGLDGMELYPGDRKSFTWTVEPENATNQQVWLTDYVSSKLDYTSYSNENRMDIRAYQSGEYTVTAYSADNPEIRQQVTIRILTLADAPTTEMTVGETARVNIDEAGTFRMLAFTPTVLCTTGPLP